jgi:hypothetical protein
MARRARPIWQIARWAVVAAPLPAVIAIHAAAITVVVRPFDPAGLAATSAPLTLVDVRGEPLATIAAQGADRLHWTRLADLPARRSPARTTSPRSRCSPRSASRA